ncbi:TAT-variant-translocated molybdopterin oxidoreductase [Geminicoccaceae bacterium 1502E]|nr:TAT-variant-translocated molybdopterin oxidoreductase [Geminicoccaceae bacterium 1502E]
MRRSGATPEITADIRRRLAGLSGRTFWRSLDELARTPAFHRFLEAEFPSLASSAGGMDRRSMLKVMGASLALAGCDGEADGAALPYVKAPEDAVPSPRQGR